MFKNLSLRQKLTAAFMFMGVQVVLMAGFGMFSSARLSKDLDIVGANSLPSVLGLWKINEGQTQVQASERALLNPSLSAEQRKAEILRIDNAWKQIKEGFKQYSSTPRSAEEEKLYKELLVKWDSWEKGHVSFLQVNQSFESLNLLNPRNKQLELLRANQASSPEMANAIKATESLVQLQQKANDNNAAFQSATDSLGGLLQLNEKVAKDALEEATGDTAQIQFWGIVSLFVGPALAIWLGLIFSKMFTDQQKLELEKVSQKKIGTALTPQFISGVIQKLAPPVNYIDQNLTYAEQYNQDFLNLLHLCQNQANLIPTEIQRHVVALSPENTSENMSQSLHSVHVGLEQLRTFLNSLQSFTAMNDVRLNKININETIEKSLMAFQDRLQANDKRPAVRVTKNYGKLPLVECYSSQINQVFFDLLAHEINALDDKMKLTNSTESFFSPEISVSTKSTQNTVTIEIAGNGLGLNENASANLSDPVSLTQPIGQNLPLELFISHQIVVDRHQGELKCNSSLAKGTQFILSLPVAVLPPA